MTDAGDTTHPPTPPPSRPSTRRASSWRRRLFLLYLAVMLASCAWRFFAPTQPTPTHQPDQSAEPNTQTQTLQLTQLPRFDRQGPTTPTNNHSVPTAFLDVGPRDAPAILLLHGSPGSHQDFQHLLPHLTQKYRVIVPDLPGFGDSPAWLPSYSTRAHARYLLALLDQLDIHRAHLFAYSMGAGVALNTFDLDPDRVASLSFYGGIGIQKGEGTGNHAFEHFKYTLGYALLVWPPELLPHFGFLGSPQQRHAFFRNFNDTDQRPFQAILQNLNPPRTPFLILHGSTDFLVPPWAAQQHHQIVEHSEMVMFNAGHFMLFSPQPTQQIAQELLLFLERNTTHPSHTPAAPKRRTFFHPGADQPTRTALPLNLNLGREVSPWVQMATIIGMSYIFEDPTTITTGLLVRDGQVDLVLALIALFIGIFTGDLGLYLLGWVGGRRLLRWEKIARRVPTEKLDAMGRWIDTHGWTAVLASRFVPGTRLPLYVAAGATGKHPARFALWTATAVAIWTVVMLALVVLLGEAATGPFRWVFGDSWLAVVAAILSLLVLMRFALAMATWTGRRRWWASISRLWRREFWPAWLFYLPLVPWLIFLALRHRSTTVWTLANPALPHGGVVGESKIQILQALGSPQQPDILPAKLAHTAHQANQLIPTLADPQNPWPVVLKPNAAQRGAGVRLAHNPNDVQKYFDNNNDNNNDILVQRFHPGPHEAGVFYLRYPHQTVGEIFAVTDKHFPTVTGNGQDTLEHLIWAHPRLRMQARVFLRRLGESARRIPANHETVPLAMAGNHCQGTKFTDGQHLITPALTEKIDAIAQRFDGFFFGRFDLRYTDPDAFRAGRDLHVVELNGVTSEATNIYDPHRSILWAYRTLFKQWQHAFAIGAANRKKLNLKPPSLFTLLRDVRRYYRTQKTDPLSD